MKAGAFNELIAKDVSPLTRCAVPRPQCGVCACAEYPVSAERIANPHTHAHALRCRGPRVRASRTSARPFRSQFAPKSPLPSELPAHHNRPEKKSRTAFCSSRVEREFIHDGIRFPPSPLNCYRRPFGTSQGSSPAPRTISFTFLYIVSPAVHSIIPV